MVLVLVLVFGLIYPLPLAFFLLLIYLLFKCSNVDKLKSFLGFWEWISFFKFHLIIVNLYCILLFIKDFLFSFPNRIFITDIAYHMGCDPEALY